MPEGKVALMSLKMYAGQSCPKRIIFLCSGGQSVLFEIAMALKESGQTDQYDLKRVQDRTKLTEIL